MKRLSADEMVHKIRKAFHLKIDCTESGIRASILDTSVLDGDGNITQLYFAEGWETIESCVEELFHNLTLHTMHKTVTGLTDRVERWYFNNDTQEFEQYMLAEGGIEQ